MTDLALDAAQSCRTISLDAFAAMLDSAESREISAETNSVVLTHVTIPSGKFYAVQDGNDVMIIAR
jgi:hypothetical protein